MNNQFSIHGIDDNRAALEARGTEAMRRIAASAPVAAGAVGTLERVGDDFSASVELILEVGCLCGYSTASTPEAALSMALGKVEARVADWIGARAAV